jgi:hypothetical protein
MLKISLVKSPGTIATCQMCDGQELEIYIDGDVIILICKECGAESNMSAEVV